MAYAARFRHIAQSQKEDPAVFVLERRVQVSRRFRLVFQTLQQ